MEGAGLSSSILPLNISAKIQPRIFFFSSLEFSCESLLASEELWKSSSGAVFFFFPRFRHVGT